MPNLNKVMLIGNLTREPEIKHTPKGTAIAAFSLAINRNYTTESGEKREEVTFVELDAFGRVAEIIGQYAKKGHPLFVEGRLKLDTWNDKQSGEKRSKLKVAVESIQLLGGRPQESAQPEDTAPEQRTARPPRPPRPPADPNLDTAADDIPF